MMTSSGRYHHKTSRSAEEESDPISPISRVSTAEGFGNRQKPGAPGEVRISFDNGRSSILPGDDDSDTTSTGSGRRRAFRRRGKRMTASRNYHNPTKIIGAEPGISATQEIDLELYARCGITCVDYGMDDMITTELINETLPEFLARPRPKWATVRWINVNGLSWDVIKCLGQYKALHRLAIEDIMNTHSRSKTDWYSDHALVVMTLQKLVHLDTTEEEHKKQKGNWFQSLFDVPDVVDSDDDSFPEVQGHSDGTETKTIQTLQRYHGGPNYERILFMEKNSSLAQKDYAVAVEQCSIFLCDDNTVISFFESSADDIEPPIMARLSSTNTLLRSSCDGSMVVQAIIDAIVDLCFPVIHAYQDTIGELELSVLTDTSLHDTQRLYILTSELALLKTTIQPLTGIINALRDHKRDPTKKGNNSMSQLTSVGISPIAHTYLGDVQDHTIVLLETVETMKRSADNLTDYIFNTVGNLQNENMRQLTIVTIFFLPLTFLTGYFGMNFTEFKGIERSDAFFWYLAVPIGVTTMLALLNGPLVRQIIKLFRRRQISKVRRLRERQERKERPRLRLNATRRLTFGPRKAKDKSSTKQANGDMTIPEEPPMPSGSETIARDMAFNDGSERITIEP
ncbi:hypothetical protein TWF173_001995 [Orbilia oligospora]|uniref:CorA metal ion transporter n=2 Tax=Orbilia oligospora TaxID=2813651 RepID=G1XTP2_ARTOA|nr:hypothetical protein AOL_s00215g171 [Orbilia oligospora ATCC 24927]EGX43435.1 hypothetical protein AOL_s00215g171 [Orbilia oligospora ATCC 24927]KAF3280118.1 hypothetical protein TWF970_002875 [Orbilia oligospora]KAF3308017.1 hypothetical protein TWF173_001995 [Orbilia oligospora]